jgi:hypothetical protein
MTVVVDIMSTSLMPLSMLFVNSSENFGI